MSPTPIIPVPGFSEPFSSLTHLIAAGVFAVLSYSLLRRAGRTRVRVVALGVFAFSCIFLLSMSGVYHLLEPGGTPRLVMRRLDHAAVFSLIAGTFTAGHCILFRRWWRWGMIALIWALAATGITLKVMFFADIPEWVGLGFYLGMGWIGFVSGLKAWVIYGLPMLKPLLIGGLAYSLGAVMEYLRSPTLIPGVVGSHEVWHLAVLTGVGFHWWFIYQHADHQPAMGEPTN